NASGIEPIDVLQPRHVTAARPAVDLAAVVVVKRRPTAGCDDHLQALVEGTDEHRVVSAERMTDRADPFRIDLGTRPQKVDTANVIEDALHGPRRVAPRFEVV